MQPSITPRVSAHTDATITGPLAYEELFTNGCAVAVHCVEKSPGSVRDTVRKYVESRGKSVATRILHPYVFFVA